MPDADERLRWGIEQRLEFIEFFLFWEGGVNRSDITSHFGVSVPQASNDLTLYRELAPANIHYDSREKRYVPTLEFAPKFLTPNADRYLAQLKAIGDQVMRLDETWIASPPPSDAMPIPSRRIEPQKLKRLLSAIRAHRSIEINYQSMNPNRPDVIWRRITPHAFGHDGFRWHIRAFCHLDEDFKDFILSRCRDFRNEDEPGASATDDGRWNNFFYVILEPNPRLTESQRETVSLDYGMPEGRLLIPVRRALLYYFNKRLRLDVAKHLDDPRETPIVVANQTEFGAALKAASS